MLNAEEILTVPGLLGDALTEAVIGGLPDRTPPAPWRSRIETAAWGFVGTRASAAALPAPLTAGPGVGVGAFISYLDGAVGPYHEVLASPRAVHAPGLPRLCGHVPFIAVDSLASIHGGRTNWALPKLPATFSGAPSRARRLTADGEGWSVAATVRAFGPWIAFAAAGVCAQPWPDATVRSFRSHFRGRMRPALLAVEVTGPDRLTSVLPSGRHLGVLIRGEVIVGAPRAAAG
jgi:hypothetical protein